MLRFDGACWLLILLLAAIVAALLRLAAVLS
jgi:hypothetical protein